MLVRRSCVLVLLVLLVLLQLSAGQDLLPCPPPDQISPCLCSAINDVDMDMDCSAVPNSAKLSDIFSKTTFPFTTFNKLTIQGNNGIVTLSDGDLGPTSFREIYITDGDLTTIGSNALSGSNDTLSLLHLYNNHITSFPFDEIAIFIKLASLQLQNNQLTSFPSIASESLEYIDLANNPLAGIPATALSNLPGLVNIQLENCELSIILTGTFTGVEPLQTINLANNLLTNMPAGAVHLLASDGSVTLNNNQISKVEIGALRGVTGEVRLVNNSLTELEDPVWRGLFDDGIKLYAENNPLTCGCGIAWLVIESDYQTRLADAITCSDGELVTDLQPETYLDMCR